MDAPAFVTATVNIPDGITIEDTTYPVAFSPVTGQFTATMPPLPPLPDDSAGPRPNPVTAPTWAGLSIAIGNYLRTTAHPTDPILDIPFVTPDGRRGTAYGMDHLRQLPKIRWHTDDPINRGPTAVLDIAGVLSGDTDDAHLRELIATVATAREELQKFKMRNKARSHNLSALVYSALAAQRRGLSTSTPASPDAPYLRPDYPRPAVSARTGFFGNIHTIRPANNSDGEPPL
jgi:hypothetical protein